METLLQDIRYGIRMLAKSRGFAVAAIIALALGIGANTAIFSAVNAVLLRPLPFKDPDRLAMIWELNRPRSRNQNVVSPANFLDWKEQSASFEQMAGFYDSRFNLTGVDVPEEIPAHQVTIDFFSTLGVNAMLGRTFAPEDEQSGAVVILTHGLWVRRFGSDPNIIGKTLKLSGKDYTAIGVLPPTFQFFAKPAAFSGKPAEIWAPLRFDADDRIRKGRFMACVGRLKQGISLQQAQSEMDAIASRLESQYPDFNKGWGANIVSLREQFAGEIKRPLLVLLGAVAFVLLIACANVANLLLARASARRREIAVRIALGAGRARIIRQLLTESLLLAIAGGGLGLILALWGTDLLLSLAPSNLFAISGSQIDLSVLGFTLAASLITGFVFGIAPAIESTRLNLSESLKESGKSTSGIRGANARNAFVIAEVALALILLIGAGLMLRSFLRLQSVDPGFNPDNLLTMRLLLPRSKYKEDHQKIAFFKEALNRIRKTQGVRSASAISFLPLSGSGAATGFTIEGRPEPPAGEKPVVDVRVIDPDYFRVMGIPLLKGRTFAEREATEASRVVVISEAMAREYFPNEDPIGKRVTIEMSDNPVPSEIVGVVGDVKHAGLDTNPRAMSYWPHPELAYSFMTIVVSAEAKPLNLASTLRNEIREMDADQPIADVRTMDSMVSDSIAAARFSAFLLAAFAVAALLLASVGIYGVISYAVVQRTQEIGIRIALGAQSADVLKLIVRHGMALTLIGLAIGLAGSFALTGVISSLLFNVSDTDTATFVAIPMLLAAVSFIACWIPARRASKVDPMVALRYE